MKAPRQPVKTTLHKWGDPYLHVIAEVYVEKHYGKDYHGRAYDWGAIRLELNGEKFFYREYMRAREAVRGAKRLYEKLPYTIFIEEYRG